LNFKSIVWQDPINLNGDVLIVQQFIGLPASQTPLGRPEIIANSIAKKGFRKREGMECRIVALE